MGPKNSRKNARKIEVPTDLHTEFVLGDIAADKEVEAGERAEGREEEEKQ